MIDWLSLLFHTSWITGCAGLLAIFSYNRWLASEGISDMSERPSWILTAAAFVLVGLGMVGTSRNLIEGIAWIVLTILFVAWLYTRPTST